MKEVVGVGIGKVIGESDLLGENNQLRRLCIGMVNSTLKLNKWFTVCHKIHGDQVDIMRIKNKDGVSLGNMVHEAYPEMEYRPAIYKYLLKNYLCYLEKPIVARDATSNSGWKDSFDKALITCNIDVIAKWLGISFEEADEAYGGKLQFFDEDDEFLVPYYKLTTNSEGVRKISNPRKDLDLSAQGTRVVPLFMLKEGVDYLYEKLQDKCYNISFCKDNGTIRDINTTFNVDYIKDIYGDTDFVRQGIDVWYDGEFLGNPRLERGYIRVFEVGGSIYDSATRSINYARIIKFEEGEPDLSFINIDIDSVLEQFETYCHTNGKINVELDEVVNTLKLFNMGETTLDENHVNSVSHLITWAEGQKILLSTVFLRNLALFMLGNPQWFEGYTGKPVEYAAQGTTDWEDDLDIG